MQTHIPRLPVLSWAYLFDRKASPLPSVLDAKFLLPTTSGRAAIALALRAIGCRAGDHVLVPTYHCPTMVAPIIALGAKALFYPIDAEGNARLDRLPEAMLNSAKAVIVPHYFGLPHPLSRVREICDAHDIALIEDCAHAFFGRSEGRPIGSWGDYAIASLTKFFPVTEGGCLISHRHPLNGLKLARRPLHSSLRILADAIELSVIHRRLTGLNLILGLAFGAKRKLRRRPSLAAPAHTHHGLGDAIRRAHLDFAPDAQPFSAIARAAWAIVRAAGSARTVRLRQTNYMGLTERLSRLKNAHPLQPDCGPDAAPYVFPLWVDKPDEVYQQVRRSGIPVFRWDDRWPGTPEQPDDWGKQWSHHVFQLGCHQDLTSADLDWIAQTLSAILDGVRP